MLAAVKNTVCEAKPAPVARPAPQAAKLFPSHAPIYAAWADLAWRQGWFKEAIKVFAMGEEQAPPHAPLLAAHAK